MSTFQSYSTYVPESVESLSSSPQIRAGSQTHRVTFGAGQMIQAVDTVTKGHSGQINPANGTDTWQATATTINGRPVETITGDSLVTINGMQAKVSFFANEGYLAKQPDGTYITGNGPQAAQIASKEDTLEVPGDIMAMVNAALEPLPPADLDQVTAHAIGVATGNLTDDSLTALFAKRSGISLEDAGQRMSAVKASYQAQANHALTSRSGISPSDIQAFYDWAKENANGQLRDAMQKQLYRNDVSGYATLASKWQRLNAPSTAALTDAGIETRTTSGVLEIRIQGQWLTPKSAAASGLI